MTATNEQMKVVLEVIALEMKTCRAILDDTVGFIDNGKFGLAANCSIVLTDKLEKIGEILFRLNPTEALEAITKANFKEDAAPSLGREDIVEANQELIEKMKEAGIAK